MGSCSGWPNCQPRPGGSVPDPFIGLPIPNDSQNPQRTASGKTLQPGVYCQPVSLSNGDFTLTTGLYVFEAGFAVSGPTSVTGDGVLLFIGHGSNSPCGATTPSFDLSNKQSFSLTPWNGGAYSGTNLVLWQSASTPDLNISGQSAATSLSGVIYAPTATLNLSSGNGSLTIGAVIAKSVLVQGNGSVVVG